jgi:hypothetical protein
MKLQDVFDEIQSLKKMVVPSPYFTAKEAAEFMKLGDKRYAIKWLVAEGYLNELPRTAYPVYSREECINLLPRIDSGLLPSSKELRDYFKNRKAA